MQLLINNQSLDLPTDLSFSMQRQSPFFSQEGSYTLPVTLPDTDNNRHILNFIHRPDVTYPVSDVTIYTAVLTVGAWQQQCTLTILSYTPGQGFEVSLLLNESNIWSRFSGVTLKQVLQTHYYDVPARTALRSGGTGGIAPTTPPEETIAILDDRANGREKDNVEQLVEEIRSRLLRDYVNDLHDDFEVVTIITPRGIINPPILPMGDDPLSDNPGYYMRIDGELMLGPQGIGHSVFLHLDYVLQACFEHIGRSLEIVFPESMQESQESIAAAFRRILILNETIDALIPGRIYFDTLVPDVPVSDLLQSMFALFGATFAEKPDGTVQMCFLEEVLSGAHAAKEPFLTRAEMQTITYKAPATLGISPQHVRHEEDVEIQTPEELSKHGNIQQDGLKWFDDMFGNIIQNEDVEAGDLGVNPANDMVCLAVNDHPEIENYALRAEPVCTNQTDYIHPVKGTTEVVYSEEQTEAPFADTTVARSTLLHQKERYLVNLRTALMPGLRNETCSVVQTVTKDDGMGGQTTEEKDVTQTDDCPLCFAYYTGRMLVWGSAIPACALPMYYYVEDHTLEYGPQLALHMSGAGQLFHHSYNAALQAGAHEVQFVCMMTLAELLNFDFCRTYMIDGTRYLPIEYQTQTDLGNDMQKVTFTMMRLP